MKLFSQTFFFCFFVALSLEFLDSVSAAKFRGYGNATNDSLILDGDYQQQDIRSSDAMLLSDEIQGTQIGEDVVLSGTGSVNLTLTHEILVFEVCKSCMGTSTVCYEASRGSHVPNAIGGCRGPSSCEFKVNGTDQKIVFGKEASVLKQLFISTCSSTTKMEHPFAHFLSDFINFESCEPKMDDNKVIKLYVNIKEGCSIKVKGAKIHLPEVQTTQLPLIGPPTQSPSNDSTKASSFPDWGYIIIGIVVLIAIAAIIGCTAYYLCKKRQTSKRVLPNVAETKPKSTVSKADVAADIEAPTKETKPNPTPSKAKEVMVETPTKKNDDLKAVKVVSTQMPKKEKKQKTTTQEPKTTEDVPAPTVSKPEPPTPASKEPAPTVTQEEPAPTEQPPPAACYPQVKRLIPRGMKSAKSDSLDQTLKKDKTAMIESFIVSTENLCLKTDQSEVSDEVKAAYPDIQHEVLDSEIKLLCVPVSEMFTEMNTLVYESIRKLAAAGYKFGVNCVIVSVSNAGRRFLKDPTTDATTVYFAFGAEHHKYITDDPEIIEKASVPLLYVIALQPRFPDASRRKACALLRRKLVKVLGWYKAADRAKMPFPINIVEHAYCRDPKYFYDPDEIKTHSGSDGKKKRIADAKRKKKSSKKR